MPAYTPTPIDTENVKLTNAQKKLVESLAENAHDVWAKQRLADGWTLGKKRNDAKKKHPCLIPYDDLPESEKTYDRIMVEQVIKAALALGYRIEAGSNS